jgi:hypothetical protein
MKSGLIFNGAAAAVPHPTISCRFGEITRAAPDAIIHQLAGRDRVHEFGADNIENLRGYRLGDRDASKTCYAMIGDDGCVHSAIYVKRDCHDVSSGFRALNGDVKGILSARVEDLNQAPRSLIFYSISNITEERGMGQLLVRNLHTHLTREHPGVVLSTLSPLRSFERDIEHLGEGQQRRAVLSYLFDIKDGVQKFHMGNGAVIGDIKLKADTMGAARAMVNYVYHPDPAVLAQNAKAFKARDLSALVAPALLAETGLRAHAPSADAPTPQAF